MIMKEKKNSFKWNGCFSKEAILTVVISPCDAASSLIIKVNQRILVTLSWGNSVKWG